GWSLVFLHEAAHLLAARARGCAGSLSISRRLYFLVAQTDMSGIRSVPRSQRYAPYLAGMTVDLMILLICFLLRATGTGGRITSVITYLVIIQLLFQFAIFMRTDVYYVITNWLRLGNLMHDVQQLLIGLVARMLGRSSGHDTNPIPTRERRLVRWYA